MTTTHKTIRLPDDLLAAIKLAAAADGRSLSNWIIQALTRAIRSSKP
jgi:predicted HicB family RNase H-like nuclease